LILNSLACDDILTTHKLGKGLSGFRREHSA
jgi:hypothetical protein